jgi:hypothetical protein
MTGNATRGTVRKFVTRILAAGALLAVYAFSTAAMTGAIMTAGVTTAQAQRGGGGGGRGGGARGGYWFPWIAPNVCHEPWTSRRVWCDLY